MFSEETEIDKKATEELKYGGRKGSTASNKSEDKQERYGILNWLAEDKKRRAETSPDTEKKKELKKQNIVSKTEEKMGEQNTIQSMLEKIYKKMEDDNKEMKENIKHIEKKLDQELKRMRNEIEDIKEETKSSKNTAIQNKKTIEKLENKVELMRREFHEKLEEKSKELQEKQKRETEAEQGRSNNKEDEKARKEIKWIVEEADRDKRKKNITISGTDFQNKDQLKEWINRKLGVNVTIRKIWKIINKEKTIGAQLETIEQKQEIMRNKKKLRSEKDKVYINNDETWAERQNRREVYRKSKELEKEGKRTKIRYNRIETDTEEYYWNEKAEKWFRKIKTDE